MNSENFDEDYTPFDMAKILREKEFPQNLCQRFYFMDSKGDQMTCSIGESIGKDIIMVACPTIQMVSKWLRNKYKLYIYVRPSSGNNELFYAHIIYNGIDLSGQVCVSQTYEGSEIDVLRFCITRLI